VTSAPSRAALAALVALVALGGAFVLGLYALTSPEQRPELLGRLAAPLAATVAGVPAFLAWLSAGRLAKAHGETSAAVTRVEHQTNGALTERINAMGDRVRDELLERLVPQQRRADDPPTEAAPAFGSPEGKTVGR
jgi:hypothetical protein